MPPTLILALAKAGALRQTGRQAVVARAGRNRSAIRLVLAALVWIGAAIPGEAATPTPTPTPTPPKVDLAAFDGARKTVALPNGETLAYVEMGDPAGKPVVLIHGYTDNARDWAPLVPYLSKSDRLILVDIRGHGQSSKPECCYAIVDLAYDIKLLLDALGVRKADLVGHSLGSVITQIFAETWPERTHRVVLISSTGGPRPGAPATARGFDFASAIRALKEPLSPDSPFMLAWWSSPTPVDADFIRREREDSATIPLRVWLAVLDQGLAHLNLQATLPRLTAPALLIWGSADPIMPDEVRQTLREALPAARVKVFAGLGHNPFWEDPRGVAAEINAFLDAGPDGRVTPQSNTKF